MILPDHDQIPFLHTPNRIDSPKQSLDYAVTFFVFPKFFFGGINNFTSPRWIDPTPLTSLKLL